MTMNAIAELGKLAQMQSGLVTTRQAAAIGVQRMQMSRMSAAGVLERITHGVYRMAGAPEPEHEEILAAWLSVSDGARTADESAVVVAGTAAARLHGLGDLWVDVIDLVCARRRTSRNPRVRMRMLQLQPREITLIDGVPAMTPMRTIADLVEQWTDLSLVADALSDASSRGMVDLSELAIHLEPLAARDGMPDGETFAAQLAADAGLGVPA
ncbi:transcriptional regulator [Microbacterium sp. CH12i]|uniref:type IV toxin-antitoxin system AbiEi family antitoxin domain-containing protein n=1 Tax=Microbacterium sp. CH12i TaxID=1479651 RepID=UPI000460F302|nr:type IV toxin-antitoxin system AbiEi family antitoxin domain-containing protein [Microbacterium sp. CH12i]KDA04636.1 transcriptional regulator [Microbacterium sp. CH12i]